MPTSTRPIRFGSARATSGARRPSDSDRPGDDTEASRPSFDHSASLAISARHGGQPRIEEQATALADEALNLQNAGSATQRVRNSLYASGAAFRSSAMWAAIDGRRYEAAKTHMREAQALAEMSGDQAIKFRIWSHAGTMYRHMGRPADAIAANDVARNLHLTRRDPLFASLGLARQGAIHGTAQNRTETRRAFEQAQDAMLRADPADQRPVWLLAFYDQAELDSLALSAYLALGDYPTAEYHAHRCLASLRPHMVRSRAIATTRLAHALLSQGAADAATATAIRVSADAATRHARVSRMLQEFGAALAPPRRAAPPSRRGPSTPSLGGRPHDHRTRHGAAHLHQLGHHPR